MEILIVMAVVVTVVIKMFATKTRNDTVRQKQELLNQQQQFFAAMYGQQNPSQKALPSSMPMQLPGMANPQAVTQNPKTFSIGWIVFFVLAALFLVWLFRPYLIGIQLFGLEGFINAMNTYGG